MNTKIYTELMTLVYVITKNLVLPLRTIIYPIAAATAAIYLVSFYTMYSMTTQSFDLHIGLMVTFKSDDMNKWIFEDKRRRLC